MAGPYRPRQNANGHARLARAAPRRFVQPEIVQAAWLQLPRDVPVPIFVSVIGDMWVPMSRATQGRSCLAGYFTAAIPLADFDAAVEAAAEELAQDMRPRRRA